MPNIKDLHNIESVYSIAEYLPSKKVLFTKTIHMYLEMHLYKLYHSKTLTVFFRYLPLHQVILIIYLGLLFLLTT